MRQPSRRPQQRSELADALAACRSAFISIGLMAGMSNILMLTGAFFMLRFTTACCRAAAFRLWSDS